MRGHVSNIPRNQWTGPSHPDTMAAFDHVDAAMFTGDPAESRERFNLYKKYVDRWLKQLDEVEPRLIERENVMTKSECPEFVKGTLVKVSQICGINVPLPAIGTINYRVNTGTEECLGGCLYSVNIIWEENVNYQCGECATKHCRKEKNVRDCDVRRDWMELA